jgi:rhodanese-related sulfurtransferase
MTTTVPVQPDTTMRELLEVFPGAQRALFKKYHIGGCSSCGFQPQETLAQLCGRNNGLSVDEVIDHIQASHEADLKMQVSPSELSRLRESDAVKILDVRTREEFDAARIEGSVFFTQELMQEALSRWNPDEAMVIVDHQGVRSMDAAAFFAGHGFTNVRSLSGGIDAWSVEIDPSVPRYHLE